MANRAVLQISQCLRGPGPRQTLGEYGPVSVKRG